MPCLSKFDFLTFFFLLSVAYFVRLSFSILKLISLSRITIASCRILISCYLGKEMVNPLNNLLVPLTPLISAWWCTHLERLVTRKESCTRMRILLLNVNKYRNVLQIGEWATEWLPWGYSSVSHVFVLAFSCCKNFFFFFVSTFLSFTRLASYRCVISLSDSKDSCLQLSSKLARTFALIFEYVS